MNEARFLDIPSGQSGQRLDNFLLKTLKGVPRPRVYRALRSGEVRVNKGRARADYRLQAGDRVRIPPLRLSERAPPAQAPKRWAALLEAAPLYEDAGLWVLNKPAGLAVHGGSGLNAGLIEWLRLLHPEEKFLELVHRLDRETSGCIMVARRASRLKELQRQLRADGIRKHYLALAAGRWPARRRAVAAPLKKNTLRSGERMVRVDESGKPARTEFEVLRRFEHCTLLRAAPVTGRTHQIRVHALHAGCPLLGDPKYAPDDLNHWTAAQGLRRLFLHAESLEFPDNTGRPQRAEAPLPKELADFLERPGL